VRFLKLLLTGSGAAGKTSFCHLLLKQKINAIHHSTNLVNSRHLISVRKALFHTKTATCSDNKVTWVELDANLEMKQLYHALLQQKSLGNLSETQDSSISKQLSSQPTIPDRYNSTSFTDKISQRLFSKSIKGDRLSCFHPILQESLTLLESSTQSKAVVKQNSEILNIITLLDTGGQPEYVHLLPTINAHPTVNIVILDVSKDLSDQVLVEYSQHGKHTFQPYHLNYTNLDMIKLLMSSINDSLERSPHNPELLTYPGTDKSSYVCLVATHTDKISPETIKVTDKKLTSLIEKMDCKASVWQYKEEGVLFPVNNTTAGEEYEDPVADVIRNKIEKVAESKDIYELPITWMLLELEIRQLCSKQNKTYISFNECLTVAKACGLMSDSQEVKSMLAYYHLLGVLLYFDKVPGLKNYVIVDHQWWFDKLSSIVCFIFQQETFSHKASRRLKYQGLLSSELLKEIKWDGDIKEDCFLSLLTHLHIIAPISAEGSERTEYFIPYVLPTYTTQQRDQILRQYGYLQGEPLLIQFQSGLLPRGLFCSLVVQLLQTPPLGWQPHLSNGDIYHTFSNLITYSLPNGFSVSLFDKISYLEIQVRHPEENFDCIHFSVYKNLMQSLTAVCHNLNFDHKRLQVGFTCQCDGNFEPHIASTPLMNPSVVFAHCSINSVNCLKLNSSHQMWCGQPPSNIGKIMLQYKLQIQ